VSRKKPHDALRLLSFFSGALGLDLGLEAEGFQTLLVSEIDAMTVATIRANRPKLPVIGDIQEFDASAIRAAAGLTAKEEIDVMAGGPPCQAFSTAGRRQGFKDERGNVFLHYIDLILTLRPRYAVIENVRGLLSAPLSHRPHEERGRGFAPLGTEERPGGALIEVVRRLESGGYGVSFNLYNAANFGCPQLRERVVIVASRDGSEVPFLVPTHAEGGAYGLRPWRTFREAVADLPDSPKDFVGFPEKRLKYYRMLGPGQYWKDLPKELHREALGGAYLAGGGKTGFFRRIAWDRPSPTLVTHPAMPATDLAHPEEDRPLSVQEYKRVQEFPDDWQLCGKITDHYRQLGNAVPVGLGRAIGRLLQAHARGETIPRFHGFAYSRYRDTDHVTWKQAAEILQHESAQEEFCF
jgi:DNA (cytosine-5)-methyltransferase 1